MNVYYENRWHQDIDELRKELDLEPPPKEIYIPPEMKV